MEQTRGIPAADTDRCPAPHLDWLDRLIPHFKLYSQKNTRIKFYSLKSTRTKSHHSKSTRFTAQKVFTCAYFKFYYPKSTHVQFTLKSSQTISIKKVGYLFAPICVQKACVCVGGGSFVADKSPQSIIWLIPESTKASTKQGHDQDNWQSLSDHSDFSHDTDDADGCVVYRWKIQGGALAVLHEVQSMSHHSWFTISVTICVTSSVYQPHAIILSSRILKSNFLKCSPCYSWKYRFDIPVGLLMFSILTPCTPPNYSQSSISSKQIFLTLSP